MEVGWPRHFQLASCIRMHVRPACCSKRNLIKHAAATTIQLSYAYATNIKRTTSFHHHQSIENTLKQKEYK